MDQNIQKALWLGVGVLMFVGIVSIGVMLFGKGKAVAQAGGDELDNISQQLAMTMYESFDNTTVKGDMVVNFIKQHKSDGGKFIIVVKNKKTTKEYISKGDADSMTKSADVNDDIKQATDATSSTYINPHAEFDSILLYDENDVVKGVSVIQK